MIRSLLALLLLPAVAAAFDPAQAGFTQVFSDDFTAASSSWETQWWYASGDLCQAAYAPGAATRTPTGLHLHIQSLEAVAPCAGSPRTYSDAHYDARPGHVQYPTTSYWEARVQASTAPGTLTAWWLIPASGAWPPEIDISEVRGDRPTVSYMTNHYVGGQQQGIFALAKPMGSQFHTYGVMLDSTAQTLTWYLDGVKRFTAPMRDGETADMFPVLTLYTGKCGDMWAGCPQGSGLPKTNWSADAYVQWIHIWRKP